MNNYRIMYQKHELNNVFATDHEPSQNKTKLSITMTDHAKNVADRLGGTTACMRNTQSGNIMVVFGETGSSLGAFFIEEFNLL